MSSTASALVNKVWNKANLDIFRLRDETLGHASELPDARFVCAIASDLAATERSSDQR